MGPSPLLSPPTIASRTSSLAWREEGDSPAGPSRTQAHAASSTCSSPPSSRRISIQTFSDDGHYQTRSTSSASGSAPPPSSFGSLAGGGAGLERRRSSFHPATSTTLTLLPPTLTTDPILQRRPSFSNQPPSNPPTDPLPPLPPSSPSPSSSSDRPPLDARFSSTSSPSPTILLSPLPRVPPSSYGGSLALMQSSLTRRRSSLALGEGQGGGGAAGGTAGLKRRPSFSPNHPPNIPLPPLPPPSSPTDSTFPTSQRQPPSRVTRASSPLFPSPKIPLPPLPPTSPSSIRSVSSSLQPPRSPRPSSSLSNHSINPPPHPPPSIPLPTLPRGPSAFRGRGTPVNSMDGASSPFGGSAASRGLDSPLKGVFGDGSPVRDFFASAAAAGSPPGAWSGEMKRSLSSEEREKVLESQHANANANAKRSERRFELTVGKMHDARIIGPSLDPNPISPISPPNRSLSPLPLPLSSSSPSIRAPSPLSTSVPKPSPLLPLRTRLSLSPPSNPKPLPPPPTDQPPANTTSPSTSSDYSNRSSTFSTSTVSSRSSTSSFGHLLPPLMPTTSTFLHHGVGAVTASKKPDLPSVLANPMSPEEGQGAFVVETETEPEGGGRTSPDVVEMRRTTARRVSSTGTKGAGEGVQEDGWGEESLLVEVRDGGGVLKEEDGESGEESDLDLRSPLATLALQSHFLSPNSRLLPQPSSTASSRRVSAISSSSAPLVGDGWGGSDSEEDDFLSSSPGRHMSGSTYKARSSLPPSLGFGAGDVRRRKMSSQEMVASFPKPPSTPTTSNRASLASVGGSEDSHGTGGGGGSLQFRLSMDSPNHQHHHHFHPPLHSSTTTATTTPTHLNRITNSSNPSRPSSDSSTYFPRPPLDRSPSPTSSRPSSLFSVGTEAGSVYSLGGKLLPRPRRGGEDDAELGEVWGPVEIAYAEMKAEGVAAGGAGSGGGGEKGSREEWEKAAEMLRERKTLSVQPATRVGGGVPLRRVSSLMQPGYGGRQTQLGLGRPTLGGGGGGGAMRRVSNGDLTVGTRIGTVASSTPARSLIPPPQKRQIATSLTIRKPVPAYTPHTPPRPPPSTLPPPAPKTATSATTPTARRIASISHLRPPSHIAFPSSPNTASKLPTPSSSILPPKSPLRKPSVSISRRTSTSSFVPPIASLLPLPKPTVSITTSSLPVPTNSLAPPSPSKQQVFPPTEPLRIIKKNASQLTLRPPPSPTASSGSASGSTSTISVALPSPTSPTMGGAGPKRRMSKVPLPPSAFRLPSQPLVRSP